MSEEASSWGLRAFASTPLLVWFALAAATVCAIADVPLMMRFVWICLVRPKFASIFGRRQTEAQRIDAFFAEHVHEARCTVRDVDLMGHMNNARYPREADFARHELMVQCGIFQRAWSRGTPFVTGAQTIRYKKEIKRGSPFIIRTSIVGWDERSVIFQQTFVAQRTSRGVPEEVIHAIMIVREGMAGSRRTTSPFAELIASLGPEWQRRVPPTSEPPADVTLWLASLAEGLTRVAGGGSGTGPHHKSS